MKDTFERNKIDLPDINMTKYIDKTLRLENQNQFEDSGYETNHPYLRESKGFKISTTSFMTMNADRERSTKRKYVLKRFDA